MNPHDQAPPNPIKFDDHQRVGNQLTVLQPGEQVLCVIKRHPIGIIGIYFVMAMVLLTIAILSFGVMPSVTQNTGSSDNIMQIGALVFLVFTAIFSVIGLIATKVYWGNQWVVTSDSVTQIAQSSLFNRQSSQLSMHSIEDVTAEQNGILAQIFKYGVLKAETAASREKFIFLYCPNPNFYARTILQAREAFEAHNQPAPPHGQSQPVQPQSQPPYQPTPPPFNPVG